MGCEGACGFVDAVRAEVSVVAVNAGCIVFGLRSLKHIFLLGSITSHELGGKVSWPKAKYPEWIRTEKRIDLDLSRVVHIFPRFKVPNTENSGRKISGWRRKRIFVHLACT